MNIRTSARAACLLALPALLAACASAPPLGRYAQPAPGPDVAEVELRLLPPSRNRSEGLYMAGAVRCNSSGGLLKLAQGSKIEEPEEFIANASGNLKGWPVVRLPAGKPLPLRFRYHSAGEQYVATIYVLLSPGARYVFDHDVLKRSVTLVDAQTGLPPLSLPPKLRFDAVTCP